MTSCAENNKSTDSAVPVQDYPDQESWDTIVKITNKGLTVGILVAGHVQKYSKKGITLLDDSVQVDFYDKEGIHSSVLNSEKGKIFDHKQNMQAFGNVIVKSDSGIILYTDTLEWDNENQKIISKIPVKITTQDGDTLYGDSFKSDPNMVNYQITNPRGVSNKIINP